MFDVRRIIIIIVIAALVGFFSFSLMDAIYPQPDWPDFCGKEAPPRYMPIEKTEVASCDDNGFYRQASVQCENSRERPVYEYDDEGCITGFTCDDCPGRYEDAEDAYLIVIFIFGAVLGLIAIAIGIFLPGGAGSLNSWIGTGFIFGGFITIFVSTTRSYDVLQGFWKPVILLAELLLVIYISYRQLGDAPSEFGKQLSKTKKSKRSAGKKKRR